MQILISYLALTSAVKVNSERTFKNVSRFLIDGLLSKLTLQTASFLTWR